jgi:hypothetical protein
VNAPDVHKATDLCVTTRATPWAVDLLIARQVGNPASLSREGFCNTHNL